MNTNAWAPRYRPRRRVTAVDPHRPRVRVTSMVLTGPILDFIPRTYWRRWRWVCDGCGLISTEWPRIHAAALADATDHAQTCLSLHYAVSYHAEATS